MTRARVIAWLMAVLVVFALRAAPARADAAAAEVLIQQGLKLRRENKPEEALQKFRQAHEMAPSSRTYGQMGLVEATLKRWTDSETHLAVALANPDDAWVHKNRAFLDQALALCREHLGDLVITGHPGAEVTVAGTPAGTLPAVPALRLAEGTVEVAATAPGYEPFKQSVAVRPSSRTVLKIAMTAAPVATAHDEPAAKVPTAPDPSTSAPSDAPVHGRSRARGIIARRALAHVDRVGIGRGGRWRSRLGHHVDRHRWRLCERRQNSNQDAVGVCGQPNSSAQRTGPV